MEGDHGYLLRGEAASAGMRHIPLLPQGRQKCVALVLANMQPPQGMLSDTWGRAAQETGPGSRKELILKLAG